jgi:hypothetical protein
MPCTGVAVASGFEIETLLPPPGDGGRSARSLPRRSNPISSPLRSGILDSA